MVKSAQTKVSPDRHAGATLSNEDDQKAVEQIDRYISQVADEMPSRRKPKPPRTYGARLNELAYHPHVRLIPQRH